jgi:hypothetical protein
MGFDRGHIGGSLQTFVFQPHAKQVLLRDCTRAEACGIEMDCILKPIGRRLESIPYLLRAGQYAAGVTLFYEGKKITRN